MAAVRDKRWTLDTDCNATKDLSCLLFVCFFVWSVLLVCLFVFLRGGGGAVGVAVSAYVLETLVLST